MLLYALSSFEQQNQYPTLRLFFYKKAIEFQPTQHFFYINLSQVYLPKGVAHGLQTIEKNTIVNYCLTSDFSPDHSFSISPFNTLEIQWPINTFKVSEKDLNGIALDDAIKKYSESLNLGLN